MSLNHAAGHTAENSASRDKFGPFVIFTFLMEFSL
jgi:hypothetical protein